MQFPSAQQLHLDIDQYLNPFVPRNRVDRLPKPLSRFLGYSESPRRDVGNILVSFWAFAGTFCGLALVAGVLLNSDTLRSYNPPALVASFGATAILEYNVIQSPLGQPRNSILGHGLAAIVGVAITKLFMLDSNFDNIRWISGAVACGLASSVMCLTNTVHPPGGATALLASIEPTVTAMGWRFVPIILIGSCLMLLVGLVINNIQRQFPAFWWTPRDVGRPKEEDVEAGTAQDPEKLGGGLSTNLGTPPQPNTIVITADEVLVPGGLALEDEDREVLRILKNRLQARAGIERSLTTSSTLSSACTHVPSQEDLSVASNKSFR